MANGEREMESHLKFAIRHLPFELLAVHNETATPSPVPHRLKKPPARATLSPKGERAVLSTSGPACSRSGDVKSRLHCQWRYEVAAKLPRVM
jgi:hypothetical protein